MSRVEKVVKLRYIPRLDHLCYDIENILVGSGASRKYLTPVGDNAWPPGKTM